jgi:hypothetical protein
MGTTSTNDFESLIHITAQSLKTSHIRGYGRSFNARNEERHEAHTLWAVCYCLIPFSEAAATRGTTLRPSGGGNGGEMAEVMAAGALPGGGVGVDGAVWRIIDRLRVGDSDIFFKTNLHLLQYSATCYIRRRYSWLPTACAGRGDMGFSIERRVRLVVTIT